MTVCDRIEARSMALAALPLTDSERVEADAHAMSCAACARRLRSGARLLDMVSEELRAEPAGFSDAEQAVLAAWDREQRRPSWRSRLGVPVTALAVFAALVAGAQHLEGDVVSWAIAVAAAAIAALAPVAAEKRTLPIVLGASALMLLLAMSGGAIPNGHSGLACMGLEIACALAPIAVWCAAGAGAMIESASSRAALAAAMALAGQAALHLSCPVRGVAVHLGFHFAGVFIAAALATQLHPRRAG